MNAKILLVEDEIDLGNVVKQYLEIVGFEVEVIAMLVLIIISKPVYIYESLILLSIEIKNSDAVSPVAAPGQLIGASKRSIQLTVSTKCIMTDPVGIPC